MTLQSPTATLIPPFSSSELTGCGYLGLLDRKNRSDMCSRWESNPRLPACKASTLSTRPGSPHTKKVPNFSAFHWSPHGCLITIGQHFVTRRVVHLPKRTETNLITESDQIRANHQLLQLCTARTAWSDSDQAVRAVHSCKRWFWDCIPCSFR